MDNNKVDMPVRFAVYLDCHHRYYMTWRKSQLAICKPKRGDFQLCTHDGLLHRVKFVRRQADATLETEVKK